MIQLDEYLEIMSKLLNFEDISEYKSKYGRQSLYEKLLEAESFYTFSNKNQEYVSNIVKEEITPHKHENNRNDETEMNITMLLCGVQ